MAAQYFSMFRADLFPLLVRHVTFTIDTSHGENVAHGVVFTHNGADGFAFRRQRVVGGVFVGVVLVTIGA